MVSVKVMVRVMVSVPFMVIVQIPNVAIKRAKSVKRFERSSGLDTALYKNIPFYLYIQIKRVLASLLTFMVDSSSCTLHVSESGGYQLGIHDYFLEAKHKMATRQSVNCVLGNIFIRS